MELAVQIVSIMFMITLIVVSILLCITSKQIHRQFRYQNYLLEKLSHNVNLLTNKDFLSDSSDKEDESSDSIIEEK